MADVTRDYFKEMAYALKSQQRAMPWMFAQESAWQPAWGSLALQNQNNYLWGAPEQTITVGNKSMTVPGGGGLMDTYARLIPQLQQYMTDPRTGQMLDTMTADAENEMALGTRLDPNQMRLVQQSVRAGQAARGMGYGKADVYGEALGASQYGQDLRTQRRAYAGDVLGVRQKIYGDRMLPMANQVLGISSGVGSSGGPAIYNPESAYAGNLFNSNAGFQALEDAKKKKSSSSSSTTNNYGSSGS